MYLYVCTVVFFRSCFKKELFWKVLGKRFSFLFCLHEKSVHYLFIKSPGSFAFDRGQLYTLTDPLLLEDDHLHLMGWLGDQYDDEVDHPTPPPTPVAGCRCVLCCTAFLYNSDIKNNQKIQEYASWCLSIKATMMIYTLRSPIGRKYR